MSIVQAHGFGRVALPLTLTLVLTISAACGSDHQDEAGAIELGGASSNSSGGRTSGGATSISGATSMSEAGGTTSMSETGGGTSMSESGGTTSMGETGGTTSMGETGGAGGEPSSKTVQLPPANAPFDYQIGGAYPPPAGVRVVSRDRNSAPAAGIYNVCYVNGFQAQPDEDSFWNAHADLLLKDKSGKPVIDTDWNETLLDTSSEAKRAALGEIVGGWIAGCATSGFDAVEIDNLDSYSRSQGLLSQENNVAFMQLLASAAHAHGLAIAQKNSSDLLDRVAQLGTDFAVAEECNRYDECADYQAAYGNLVFVIGYRPQDFQKGCTNFPELSIVLRDLDVSTPGSSSYVYQGC